MPRRVLPKVRNFTSNNLVPEVRVHSLRYFPSASLPLLSKMGFLSASQAEFGSRLLVTSVVIWVLYLLRVRYSRGLNKFPGPFLASFTDLWKIWYIYTTPEQNLYLDIHRKYGDVVRIGPKQLSFADPRAINEIYGTGGGNQKVRLCNPRVKGIPDGAGANARIFRSQTPMLLRRHL